MDFHFINFIKEREYLHNVSKRTLQWYTNCFSAWKKYATDNDPMKFVVNMREAGVLPVSCNTYICGMNAYFKWAGEPIKLRKLKLEQRILATLTDGHIKSLISYRPGGTNSVRAHIVALTILDTGLRISEILGLSKENVDWDQLTLRVHGKGGKHRLVPFSFELRKRLFRYVNPVKDSVPGSAPTPTLLFGTKNNTKVSVRNIERDFEILGKSVGITGVRFSPHTLRHSFAVGYLRAGGNLEFLRRILGHSSILTTQKYLRSLGVEDLRAVHNSLSLLTRG